MRSAVGGLIFGISVVLAAIQPGKAAITGTQRLAVGHTLSAPAFATHAPGDRNRLFVAELGGDIEILDLNNLNAPPIQFLDITDTDAAGEGGLLGLAFHPNYFAPAGTTGRGKFYVYVTVDNGGIPIGGGEMSPFSSHIREYTVMGDPATSNVADPASKREILSFVQPQTNHNAGWIGFNPATTLGQPQYLYIASGDGGNGNDVGNGHTAVIGNAQDITNNLLGKMLRLDVNGDDFPADANRNYAIPPTNPFKAGVGSSADDVGDDEIWSYGLRNPYRDSFDRLTGDLWMGDVGQGAREEIDFQPASSSGGENYGWRFREGNIPTPGIPAPPADHPFNPVSPIYDYERSQGTTVIGGYRYRGPDADVQGQYIFGDLGSRNVWQLIPSSPPQQVTNINSSLNNLAGINQIVSFAEDAIGRMYIVDLDGEVHRILTTRMPGDFNHDNIINRIDIDMLAAAAQNGGSLALYDLNGSGAVEFDPTTPPDPPDPNYEPTDSEILIRTLVETLNSEGEPGIGTEYGDANLDGTIDVRDLAQLGRGYQGLGTGWAFGNFDGNEDPPNVRDLAILGRNYGFVQGQSGALGQFVVPEPSAALQAVVLMAWFSLLRGSLAGCVGRRAARR
jgi:glucose/arabinose dehydrogenase